MKTRQVTVTPPPYHGEQRVRALFLGIAIAMLVVSGTQAKEAPDVQPFAASTLGHWALDGSKGAGRYGKGIDLDGRKDYLKLGDLGSVAETTIAFWVNPRNAGKDDYQGLVTTPSWGKGMLHLPIYKGRIDAYLHLGGSGRARVKSGPLTNGRWTHVGVTISAITGRMVLYVDGVKVDEAAEWGVGKVVVDNMVAGHEGTTRYFDGLLDEIVILSRALSPQGMAYLAGKGGELPAKDRLAGYPAVMGKQRAWQLRERAPVKGALVKMKGKQIVLRVEDEQGLPVEMSVAVSDLTEADALYVRYLADASRTPVDANAARRRDWRNIHAGTAIPDEGYCDQPYVAITKDGNWLCTLTTGKGHEGQRGQHVVATISKDKGKTWSPLVDIEPASGPEASWVVPLVVSSGRVYAFYTYNGDNVRTLPGSTRRIRSDTHGWYAFKYSDDHGKTWSKERYRIPVRATAADWGNQWKGKVMHFWGIDTPKISKSGVRFAFTKLGRYFLGNGEGWIMHSDNILTEAAPKKINWQTLPDGEHGPRVPEFGSIQEEHNHVSIGEKRLYMVYRTKLGYPIECYSYDGGHTWTKPTYMTYSPGGRKIKTMRACAKLWRCKNGKYLFWFHNQSGKTFYGRNPVWLTGGVVRNGKMHWSEPEILLYHNTPKGRGMSYPDLVEQDGRYWFTETQKSIARIHEVPAELIEGLWGQLDGKPAVAKDSMISLGGDDIAAGRTVDLPELPNLASGDGFSLDVWLKLNDLAAGQILLDSRDQTGCGFALATGQKGSLVLSMNDGRRSATWASDPGVLTAGKLHHVVFIVDGGPCVISVVSDGVLNDGGTHRQFGWGRFDPNFSNPSGGALRVAPKLKGRLKHLRIYNRHLRTSEAVGNWKADSAGRK